MPDSNTSEHNFARVIAISSGKGGVGKSTLATNLGIALSNAGNKVCLFDADTNLANLNILLGINPVHTLEHFFSQELSINDVLTKGPGGIDLVCGASGVADFIQLSSMQQKKLTQALHLLEQNYQYLLIDTAAGIDETNISLILAAPYLLLIITAEPTSLTDAFSLLRVLKNNQFQQPVLVVVNVANSQKSAQAIFKRFKTAVTKYLQLKSIHLAGYILKDKNIPVSIINQQAILLSHPDSPASQCINNICKRLLTSFGKSSQADTSFSDYFSDLTLFDALDKQIQESEPNSSSDSPADCSTELNKSVRQHKSAQKSAQIGLMQACSYARLLSEQKRDAASAELKFREAVQE